MTRSDGAAARRGEAAASASFEDTRLTGGQYGVYAEMLGYSSTRTRVTVERSTLSSASHGLYAKSPTYADTLDATLTGNLIAGNSIDGIKAEGLGVRLTASGNTVTQNGTGLVQLGSALLESTGDNVVRSNGAPSSGTISSAGKL